MKKQSFLVYLFLVFIAFSSSCSDEFEPVDPAIQIPSNGGGNNGGGRNNGGGGNNGGGVSTGDYWPMTINNQWIFSQSGVDQPPMKIIGTEQYNGKTYFTYDNLFGVSTAGDEFEGIIATRKENGVYYYLVAVNIPSVDGSPEISVSPLEIIVLKDFLEVNETWTQNLTQTTTITGVPPITTAVNITGKVLERDATLEVGSTTFENVIKVEVIQNTQGQVNTNYYWFAKDIGVIKYQNIIQGTNTTSELVSYTIN